MVIFLPNPRSHKCCVVFVVHNEGQVLSPACIIIIAIIIIMLIIITTTTPIIIIMKANILDVLSLKKT